DQKPLLPLLWNRIKRFLADYANGPKETHNRLQRKIRFLEHCLLKDDAIEATRIQLEHNWEDVSI
ncbi:MAG: hypothetical protein AAGL17_25895, partial [Cyanobacteria bacterium J06576_12]